jgi:TetR/AcrR family transcriptional repressor of mexJK operon
LSETSKLDANETLVDGSVADRILKAAYTVFMANGFSGTTTDEIQIASGTSKSTIYRYFPSKEILFNAALESQFDNFLRTVREVDVTFTDTSSFLEEFGYRFLRQLLSQEGLDVCRLMIAESQRFPRLGKMFYRIGPKPINDIVETHLADAHRRGEVSIRSPAVAAEHFIGMVRGDLHLRCLLGEKTPSDAQLKRFVATTVEAFLVAYAPTGS